MYSLIIVSLFYANAPNITTEQILEYVVVTVKAETPTYLSNASFVIHAWS